jgi:hypothetical protein
MSPTSYQTAPPRAAQATRPKSTAKSYRNVGAVRLPDHLTLTHNVDVRLVVEQMVNVDPPLTSAFALFLSVKVCPQTARALSLALPPPRKTNYNQLCVFRR